MKDLNRKTRELTEQAKRVEKEKKEYNTILETIEPSIKERFNQYMDTFLQHTKKSKHCQ